MDITRTTTGTTEGLSAELWRSALGGNEAARQELLRRIMRGGRPPRAPEAKEMKRAA